MHVGTCMCAFLHVQIYVHVCMCVNPGAYLCAVHVFVCIFMCVHKCICRCCSYVCVHMFEYIL